MADFTPEEPKGAKPLEHDHELVAARFSPCGTYLFAGAYDGNVYRWDVATGAKTVIRGHSGWIQGLAFHPDGRRLFTADSWGGLRCWNYADAGPAPLWTRDGAHPRWMRSLALSPDGALLATCGADRVVRTWSAADGAPRWESPAQPDDLLCVAFHPGGGSLICGDLKGKVTEWAADGPTVKRVLNASVLYLRPTVQGTREVNDVGGVRAIAFDVDGKHVAVGGSQPATSGFFTGKPTVVLFDWATGERRHVWQWDAADPAEGIVLDLQWNPAGGFFMAASSGQPGKGAIACWKPGEKAPAYVDKKLAHCRSTSLHPDGTKLAVAQVLIKPGQNAGNGRRLNKDGDYVGLIGHVRLFGLGGGAGKS